MARKYIRIYDAKLGFWHVAFRDESDVDRDSYSLASDIPPFTSTEALAMIVDALNFQHGHQSIPYNPV